MKEPFYPEGFELFECPICEESDVKYRFNVNPTTGKVIHWGECNSPMCHTLHELHSPESKPDYPSTLLVLENLRHKQLLHEVYKLDPIIRKAAKKLKQLSEDPEVVKQYLRREAELREIKNKNDS